MKIAGFEITKKKMIIGGVVILVILIFSSASNARKQAEKQARLEAIRREKAISEQATESNVTLSRDELIQQELVKEYGEAPEGFEWDRRGNLIALSDDTLTAEEVVYTYLRSLSILDFSTAQRYSLDSTATSEYLSFFTESSEAITDYYDDFLRKQYKFSLTTLEVDSIDGTAILADGTEMFTVNIKALDLTDKDFWRDKHDELYDTLRVYTETEDDDTKAEKALYDFIYDSYTNGDVGKKEYTIDIKVSKANGKGWLVTDDSELIEILRYDKGLDVAQYIQSDFQVWLRERQAEDRREEMERLREEQQKERENSLESSKNK